LKTEKFFIKINNKKLFKILVAWWKNKITCKASFWRWKTI
jgi:hypothetical protein